MAFQFTAQQIAQFRSEGWVAVPDFWSTDEVAAMRAELDRLKDEGLLRNVATEGDGVTHSKVKANLQLCPMSPHSPFFRAMPWAPKVAEATEQLIGGPLLLHLDQVFLKPAEHGAGTNWHQDNAYFHMANPLHGTALWTAVHDANIANGTIRVVPASFTEQLEHRRDPDSDHHIRCYPDESRAVPVELPAGGAVFFAYGTPHATGPNNTAADRAGIALHLLNAAAQCTQGQDVLERMPVLTGPNSTGGEAEYGVRVAGTWDAEVAKLMVPEPTP